MDSDGINACSIMYNYLKNFVEDDLISYSHSQRSKGHGVGTVLPDLEVENETLIRKIPRDTDLVIIVDSSSNDLKDTKELIEQIGCEVIIIDHHEMDLENIYATVVNCQDGEYPNPKLSGSAMVYKVCQVIDEKIGEEFADDFLDLVAIGLIGDVMSVREMENRYLINKGISQINNKGLNILLKKAKVDTYRGISSTDISFKISPMISACSRFDKIELAIELLTTEDEDRMKKLSKEMIELNERRKSEQKEMVERFAEGLDDSNNIMIVITDEIESGFRGLIASEVASKYNKPAFVLYPMKDSNGDIFEYSGSARGVGNIPLKDLCQDSGLFNFATGHQSAHGLSFNADKYDEVVKYFNEVLDDSDFEKVIYYDLEVDANELEELDLKEIEKFSRIVGEGFKEPKFKVTGLTLAEKETKKLGSHVRAVMGKNKDTVKIICENDFALMKFRSNEDFAKDLEDEFYGDAFMVEVEAVGSLNLNVFYNFGTKVTEVTKQVFIEDYRLV